MPNFFDDLSPPKTETDPWSEAGFWLLGRAVEAAKPNSSTYQALVAEGRSKGHIEGTRAIILRMGTKRFGPPDAETQAVLAAATILERVREIKDRLLDANNWSELMA